MTSRSDRAKDVWKPPAFVNERVFPGLDDPGVQVAFPQALVAARAQLGKTYPLYIDGDDVLI